MEEIHTYVCEECTEVFTDSRTLNFHKRRVHNGEKIFSCYDCDKVFDSIDEIKTHYITIHSALSPEKNDEPFVCDVCGKGYSFKSSLIDHNRIHTGEKPFVCDVCKKGFTAGSNLKIHQRIHTGEKPFVCEVCEKDFSQRSSFDRHLKSAVHLLKVNSKIVEVNVIEEYIKVEIMENETNDVDDPLLC